MKMSQVKSYIERHNALVNQASQTDREVECPRCGGNWFSDLDEEGKPYTCFCCCNTGYVRERVPSAVPTGNWHSTEIRSTYRFTDNWSGKDEWLPINGVFNKIVRGKAHRESDEYDARYTFWTEITFSMPLPKGVVEAFAKGQFARGCSCEYDCCGHYFGGSHEVVNASKNGRRWKVKVRYAPNY